MPCVRGRVFCLRFMNVFIDCAAQCPAASSSAHVSPKVRAFTPANVLFMAGRRGVYEGICSSATFLITAPSSDRSFYYYFRSPLLNWHSVPRTLFKSVLQKFEASDSGIV